MNIVKIILDIIIILLLIVAATFVTIRVIGYKPYKILTGSMSPTLEQNTVIFVKEIKFEDIKENDIITFKNENGDVVTHRVMAVDTENGQLITKGDNNEWIDIYPIKKDAVIGKMAFKVPYSNIIVSKFNDIKGRVKK